MNPFDSFFWSEHKYKIIGGILALLFLIILLIFGKSCDKTTPKDKVEESLSSPIVVETKESSEVEDEGEIETEIMRLNDYTLNEVYSVIYAQSNSGNTRTYVTKNLGFYGNSNYNYTLEPYKEYDFITFEQVISKDEELTEELAPSTFTLEALADKAISEGMIYSLSTDESIKFVNNLIQEGYTLQYKVSTSKYTEVYLSDLSIKDPPCLRIIIPEYEDILIISELSNISEVDLDKILQIKDMEEVYETQS